MYPGTIIGEDIQSWDRETVIDKLIHRVSQLMKRKERWRTPRSVGTGVPENKLCQNEHRGKKYGDNHYGFAVLHIYQDFPTMLIITYFIITALLQQSLEVFYSQ
jgi:hypothetical protein